MTRPFKYQIPHLNMLLGAFESWGVGKWATIQDVVVRSKIRLDMTEAETLAQYLIADGYIKESLKVKGYNLAQVPGTGMVDIPYGDAGYELTPKGKQFHLDGGYRRERHEQAEIPKTKPDNHIKPHTTIVLRVWARIAKLPVWSKVGSVALVVFGVWLTINWDGHFTIASFKSLFGFSP